MGMRGVDYEALLKRYLGHLLDQYGEDYVDEALHLADAYPSASELEIAAFQVALSEVLQERRLARAPIHKGIC